MKRQKLFSSAAVFAALSLFVHTASAVPVTLPGFTGFGYNTIDGSGNGFDGQPGAIGCGPTSGAMIFNWYASHGAPGLIGDPLVDARTMAGSTYMNVNSGGFGSPFDFQEGFEQFALDRGYIVDAQIHVEPTTFNPANWTGYGPSPVDPDVVADATFWSDTVNFQTIDTTAFLNFVKPHIDAGNPVGVTVDSTPNDGQNGGDHWMVLVGYDLAAGTWAGYTTWDSTLQWFDVESAFKANNTMGIAFVRTFDLIGPVDGGNGVPETGSTLFLFGFGMLVTAFARHRLAQASR